MTAQTALDLDIQTAPAKTKTYRVQKYHLSYTREPGYRESFAITSKIDAQEACQKYLRNHPIEKFLIIALDNNNKIIGYTSFDGIPNQCVVYPQQVFRFLLSAGASAFIVAHNHPGGSIRASEADWQVTERLYKAGKLLDITMHDHLIVADDSAKSLREEHRWPN